MNPKIKAKPSTKPAFSIDRRPYLPVGDVRFEGDLDSDDTLTIASSSWPFRMSAFVVAPLAHVSRHLVHIDFGPALGALHAVAFSFLDFSAFLADSASGSSRLRGMIT